jgi:hypothetical protein
MLHVRKLPALVVALGIVLAVCVLPCQAAQLLVSDSGGTLNYGYGYSNWVNFTAAINSAFGGAGNVTVVPDLTNAGQVAAADAVFLDQRWLTGTLSATEITNIQNFIASGKRIVMIGENSSWNPWDQQILGIVGGTFVTDFGGVTTPVLVHPLTAGVTQLNLAAAGIASGGTPLFDQNFATLWGAQNVLTVLDVNVFDESHWPDPNHTQWGNNVAVWLAGAVPEPSSAILAAIGAALFVVWRARKSRALA